MTDNFKSRDIWTWQILHIMLSAHVKHMAHCYLHMFIAMHILLSAHVKHTAHCYLHMLSIRHIAICTVPPSVIFYLNIINSPCVEGWEMYVLLKQGMIYFLMGSMCVSKLNVYWKSDLCVLNCEHNETCSKLPLAGTFFISLPVIFFCLLVFW